MKWFNKEEKPKHVNPVDEFCMERHEVLNASDATRLVEEYERLRQLHEDP